MSARDNTVWRRMIVVLAAAAFVALGGGTEAQETPLAGELVKMLEAELSEEIILEWLESAERPSGQLPADDLIALKKAGASPDLMRRLLELHREHSTESEPSVPSAEAEPRAPGPSPPTSTETTGAAADVMATVVLSYLARIEDPDPEWDLYVYVDGIPVSYVSHQGIQNRPSVIEFARSVPPGRHTVRVTQERHDRRRGGWVHHTRVADEAFDFELRPGLPARIEVAFHERMLDYSNPVTFKFVQGDVIVDSNRVGGEADFWPVLCEDVEASIADGEQPSRAQRRQLEDCVRWGSLWEAAPSRAEVLEAMSRFDYRPLPKGS